MNEDEITLDLDELEEPVVETPEAPPAAPPAAPVQPQYTEEQIEAYALSVAKQKGWGPSVTPAHAEPEDDLSWEDQIIQKAKAEARREFEAEFNAKLDERFAPQSRETILAQGRKAGLTADEQAALEEIVSRVSDDEATKMARSQQGETLAYAIIGQREVERRKAGTPKQIIGESATPTGQGRSITLNTESSGKLRELTELFGEKDPKSGKLVLSKHMMDSFLKSEGL